MPKKMLFCFPTSQTVQFSEESWRYKSWEYYKLCSGIGKIDEEKLKIRQELDVSNADGQKALNHNFKNSGRVMHLTSAKKKAVPANFIVPTQ